MSSDTVAITTNNRPQVVDSVYRRGKPPIVRQPAPPHPAAATPNTPRPERAYQTVKPVGHPRRWRRLQPLLLALAGLSGSALGQSALFGTVLVVIYGIAVFVRRLPSRQAFLFAALSIGTVCVSLLFKPNEEIVSNFSTYTYLFLIIGVLAIARESRLPKRTYRRR